MEIDHGTRVFRVISGEPTPHFLRRKTSASHAFVFSDQEVNKVGACTLFVIPVARSAGRNPGANTMLRHPWVPGSSLRDEPGMTSCV